MKTVVVFTVGLMVLPAVMAAAQQPPKFPPSRFRGAPGAPTPQTAPPGPQGSSRTSSATAEPLSSGDCGNHVRYTNPAGVTVSVPANLLDVCDVALWQLGGTVTVKPADNTVTFDPSPLGFTKSMGPNSDILVNFATGSKSPDGKPHYTITGLGAK